MKAFVCVITLVVSLQASASCLTEAADFASSVCGQIQNSGSKEVTTADGKLNAEVSGILRRLAGQAGAELDVKHLADTYENVLREDLAKELFNVRDCRIKMAEAGIREVCNNAPSAGNPPTINYSRTCSYNAGPKAGQTEYFPPEIPITPAIVGQPCQDGMGSWGYAVQDQ